MAGKRKFSESFYSDTDVVQNLLKYRATSMPYQQSNTVLAANITQENLRTILDNFVHVYEGLNANEGFSKPNFSYTELIFLAIMRSPNFCLPISEIYRYIETRFPFFRQSTREHWKNAIRHSLSKTKCFTKIGLENQKPRNGILNRSAFLWTIMPKSLMNFARGDYRPTNKVAGSNALKSRYQKDNAAGLWEGCVLALTSRIEAFRDILNDSPMPAKIFQIQVCNLADFNSSGGLSLGPAAAITFPVSPAEESRKVNNLELSPTNHSASYPTTGQSSEPVSPNSETGSDSFYSNSPSDSSGYDTIGELSSPEHAYSSRGYHQVTSPTDMKAFFPSILNITHGTVEEQDTTLVCIFSVPMIPELPPLDKSYEIPGGGDLSLPCMLDNPIESVGILPSCQYKTTTDENLSQEATISLEERFILEEFLSF